MVPSPLRAAHQRGRAPLLRAGTTFPGVPRGTGALRARRAMEEPPRHRARYKGPAAPPWKETYRRLCMERLRSSRAKLLDRYRQAGERASGAAASTLLVREVMEQEWQSLQAAQQSLPSLGGGGAQAQMLEDPDELAVLEEIQQELMLQEQSVTEEYERSLQLDEEWLSTMLEGLDASDKIICPVCRKNNLTVRSHIVFCQCGLYIVTQRRL
ncbi:RPA-interacting protein isoform 1-T1 [Porphyrio hochstetteri]